MNLLRIKTPAQDVARVLASRYGLENHGITNPGNVYFNLDVPALYEEAIFRGEGHIVQGGALAVRTGSHTARAAGDKYIVYEATSADRIWWGEYNRPMAKEKFSALLSRINAFLQDRDLFVQDCYASSSEAHRLRLRIITEYAWHSLFARSMFIKPRSSEELVRFVPEFTLICVPSFRAHEAIDGTASPTVIALSFETNVAIIAGTAYAGEIKKSVFTLMNYLLPLRGVLSMHCSANVGDDGKTALFFGLSGTGKTSLSADPRRGLIGDDEHGWDDEGVFNIEGGCYAKVIGLSKEDEPDIYNAVNRFGAILENVVYDETTRRVDFDDDSITENTRASYPLDFIRNAVPERRGGHPRDIIFLTCDANGVLPPIARLTPQQAIYHFMSGYTSKVAGTEVGVGREPQMTFSAAFGAPFMVFHPYVYAKMLSEKMIRHNCRCWLVNTGWTQGPYGIGKRISISLTRAMLDAALSGRLDDVPMRKDEIFGFEVPKVCPGVPDQVLDPKATWPDKEAYEQRYRDLAARFIQNFKRFSGSCPAEVALGGPRLY